MQATAARRFASGPSSAGRPLGGIALAHPAHAEASARWLAKYIRVGTLVCWLGHDMIWERNPGQYPHVSTTVCTVFHFQSVANLRLETCVHYAAQKSSRNRFSLALTECTIGARTHQHGQGCGRILCAKCVCVLHITRKITQNLKCLPGSALA